MVTAQVGADGILTLTVPLARTDTNKTLRVTVEMADSAAEPTTPAKDHSEWLRFIQATAGKWQGDLERPP